MAAGANWIRPCQDDHPENQFVHPVSAPAPLRHTTTSCRYNVSALATLHQDERRLPPISKAIYTPLRTPPSPRSTTQHSPLDKAGALPPISESSASPEPHRCPRLRCEHRYEPPVRRLSLPPLANDRGAREHDKDNQRWEHVYAQPNRMQRQQHLSDIQTKPHLSSTDVPDAAAYVNSESDWPAGRSFGMIKDQEMPRAAEKAPMKHRQNCGTLHALVQAVMSELVLLASGLRRAGGSLDRSSQVILLITLGVTKLALFDKYLTY